MAIGWKQIAGKWYYFNGSGAMLTGWAKIGGSWYYFASNGVMQTGWLKYDGYWYYLDSNGAMLQNTSRQISGKNYTFDASGKCTNP